MSAQPGVTIGGGGHGREVRFILAFAILAVSAFAVLYVGHDVLVVPLNGQIARVAGLVMWWLGGDVAVTGAVVQARGFAVEIKNNCNAIYELGLFAAAVWAYPASVGARVVGSLVGAAVLNVVNLARVVSLIAVGIFAREWFDVAHVYVWQGVFFAVVAVCWFGWVLRAGSRA